KICFWRRCNVFEDEPCSVLTNCSKEPLWLLIKIWLVMNSLVFAVDPFSANEKGISDPCDLRVVQPGYECSIGLSVAKVYCEICLPRLEEPAKVACREPVS